MTTISMPTKKKRINITVSDEEADLIELLAKKDGVPVAAKAKELLEMGMEYIEDLGFSMIAAERMANDDGTRISHEEAWS